MAELLNHLPEPLVQFLQQPRLVQLTTLDAATGGPFVNTLSWVLAYSPERIRLMADMRTKFMKNIQADGRVALSVLGAGSAWTIYGKARVLVERTPGVQLPLAMVEVSDLQVVESMFFGARLTQEPAWEVTYSEEVASKLDAAVFAAMREYQ